MSEFFKDEADGHLHFHDAANGYHSVFVGAGCFHVVAHGPGTDIGVISLDKAGVEHMMAAMVGFMVTDRLPSPKSVEAIVVDVRARHEARMKARATKPRPATP
jgi:hypothetical protein